MGWPNFLNINLIFKSFRVECARRLWDWRNSKLGHGDPMTMCMNVYSIFVLFNEGIKR